MWVAFVKATHIFFCKNISVYAILNDQSFNDTLTNGIVSFEQLDPKQYLKTNNKEEIHYLNLYFIFFFFFFFFLLSIVSLVIESKKSNVYG